MLNISDERSTTMLNLDELFAILHPKMVAVFVHSNVRFSERLRDSMRTNDRLSHPLSVQNILYAKICRDW